MPVYEVFTTGGGYYVTDIMNFLAMFTSGSQFQDMIAIGLTASVIYLAVKFAITGNMEGTLQYIILLALVSGLSIGAKARVVVMDTTYPLEIYATVDNVPLSVAFVANITTTVSYHLTDTMETLLSPPDDLSYQKHGMLFGANLMAQAARWRGATNSMHANMVSFMEGCMVNGANIGLLDHQELTQSGDLSSFIAANAPGALAYYDVSTGATTRCTDGWAGISAALGLEVPKVLAREAAIIAPADGTAAGVVNTGALTGPLEDFQNLMGYTGAGATNYIRQTMLINALDEGVSRKIASSGNSAAMDSYLKARTDIQTKASYTAITAGAAKWVPLIKITFEILYYGAFPMALLLMLTPMAMTVMRGYFGGFVWLAAWEPLNAILNTVVTKAATGYYREHTTTLTGVATEQYVTWANHLGVQAVEQDVANVAGFMMMSIPFLATGIFFGAGKIAGLATSMLNVSQGAAIEAGREAATGNISLGNVNMNNMAANKWNTSKVSDTGRSTYNLGDGSMVTRNNDGSSTFGMGSAQSSVGMSGSVGNSVRTEMSSRLSSANRSVQSTANDLAESISTASSELSEFAKSATSTDSSGRRSSAGFNSSANKSLSDSWATVQKVAQENGVSTDVAMSAMAAGNLAAGGNFGVAEARLSAGLEGRLTGTSREGFRKIFDAAKSGSYGETYSNIRDASEASYSEESGSQGTSASNSLRSALDNVNSNTVRMSDAYEHAQSLENATSNLSSNSSAYDTKITDALIDKMQKDGYSEDQIAAIVNPKSAAGVKEQRGVVGQYLPGILTDLGLGKVELGSGPRNAVQGSPGIRDFQPIDQSSASGRLAAPTSRNYEAGVRNHNRISDGNWDHVQQGMDNAHAQKAGVEQNSQTIGKAAGMWVPDAISRRAAGMVGFDASPAGHIGEGAGTDVQGFYRAPNIRYEFDKNTVRDLPPSTETMGHISDTVRNMGTEYGFVVTSAGQPEHGAEGIERTGSHRHDVNQPQSAVDGYLTRNGERLYPGNSRNEYARFIEGAAERLPGIGHYKWGVHAGGGEPALWGPDTNVESADPYFQNAYDKGSSRR